jgi:hypothetical protein
MIMLRIPVVLLVTIMMLGAIDRKSYSSSENKEISIEFEMDGVPRVAPSSIQIRSIDGNILAYAEIKEGKLYVPAKIISSPVVIVIEFQKRRMVFAYIYPAKFDCSWKVGIDTPPFDIDNVIDKNSKKAKELWYIKCCGTIIVVAVK